MTVSKVNGFRAPYRSQTFRSEVDLLVHRNGVLSIHGAVTQVGLNITVPPLAFVQQGLMVKVDTATVVTAPSMAAPYYLVVTSLSTSNIDDLRWQFAKSPLDLSNTEVIVASYDGLEWRATQLLTFDGVYSDIDDAHVDFGEVGPFSGLLTTVLGANYSNAAGKLVDQQGLRTRLAATALFPAVAIDPDYSRVDKILYRRPDDSPNRIGTRELHLGGTFDTVPSVIKNTQYLDSSAVRQNVKTLVTADNVAHVFTATGYGTTFQMTHTTVSSDRLTASAGSSLFSDMTDPVFDVALDNGGNFHFVYTAGQHIMFRKYSDAGVFLMPYPTTVDTQSTQCLHPAVSIDPANTAVFIAYQCQTGVGVSQIYFRTLTMGGAPAVDPKSVAGVLSYYTDPSIFVTGDLWVYLSWTDQTAGQVYYQVFDDIGTPFSATPTIVSGNTTKGSGSLSGGAKKSLIRVSNNKSVVVGFLQDKGAGVFGLSLWIDGVATMQTLISSGENFTAWDLNIEDIFNGLNISVVQASRADYVKIDSGAILYALQLSTAGVASVSSKIDRLGSMFHAWSLPQAGTYTSYASSVTIERIGPTSFTGMTTVSVAPNQMTCAVASLSTAPKAGDRVVISDSPGVNNGTYTIASVALISVGATNDRYLLSMTSNFTASEVVKHGTFSAPDGNTSRFAKSVADTKAMAYRYTTLDTDVLLSRIVMPGPIILNYVTHTGPSEIRKPYLVGGTNVQINWGKTAASELTITGGLKLLNLLDNLVYSPADGSYLMNEGDAMYVVLDGINMSPVPQVTPRAMLPWGTPIQVIGVIEEGLFSPLLLSEEMTQLDVGEQDTVGEDLPVSLRQRLGITTETTYQPYTSTYVINSTDTYPEALSGLDARVEALETNHPDEEEFIGDGSTTTFTLTRFLVNASNSIYDNQVWISGRKQVQDPTGGLTKAYRKISTTQIQFAEAPTLGVEITVRKEGTNYGGPIPPLSGKLWSDPVDSNITGPDLAYKAGTASNRFSEVHAQKVVTEQVQFALPIGNISLIKAMISGVSSAMTAGQPVSKYSDGKMYPADSDSAKGQNFIGVLAENVAGFGSGRVVTAGPNIPGALSGMGFAPGEDIYLSETGGGYVNTPAGYTGNNDTIARVGIADCGDGVANSSATDLVIATYIIARP